MSRDLRRQLVVVLAILATIVVNSLASALPLNGQTTGEISDRFAIFFVPSGYVFSIWGLIYLGLLAYGVFQALPAQRANPRLRAIGNWFVLASLANMVWIFLWHYEQFALTLVVMLALLLSLMIIYLRLRSGGLTVGAAESWAVRVPFSVYLGWISVATIANASQVLYHAGWTGLGLSPAAWAAIMLGVATVLALLMALSRRDTAFLLVLVWAFVGIAIKHQATALVSVTAWIGTALVVLMVMWSIFVRQTRGQGSLPRVA